MRVPIILNTISEKHNHFLVNPIKHLIISFCFAHFCNSSPPWSLIIYLLSVFCPAYSSLSCFQVSFYFYYKIFLSIFLSSISLNSFCHIISEPLGLYVEFIFLNGWYASFVNMVTNFFVTPPFKRWALIPLLLRLNLVTSF